MKRLVLLLAVAALPSWALAQAPQPLPVVTKGPDQTFYLDWTGVPGRTYFVQHSDDLLHWQYLEMIQTGTGEPMGCAFATTATSGFFRLRATDQPIVDSPENDDFDGDGLSNIAELNSFTPSDPLNPDADGDGLNDLHEVLYGTNPQNRDSDGDGLADGEEVWTYSSDPTSSDSDTDGLGDFDEIVVYGSNPMSYDTDGDGLSDGDEVHLHLTDPVKVDTDGDGLSDSDEWYWWSSDPTLSDTDHDGMGDGFEVTYFSDPFAGDALGDNDNDGMSNVAEFFAQANPLHFDLDSDQDSLADPLEVYLGLNPGAGDSDNDGISDANEDTDGDGMSNGNELSTASDPGKADTDGDWMTDAWEIAQGLNPNDPTGNNGGNADPDQDGLTNLEEYLNGSNPHAADSDGDGTNDAAEVAAGGDPMNAGDQGAAPPPEQVEEVPFTIYGDYAAWEMTVTAQGPEDHRVQKLVTTEPALRQTKPLKLRRGNKYEIKMLHLKSKQGEPKTWWCWEARVDDQPADWTYESYDDTRLAGVAEFLVVGDHWVVDNRDGLLTKHVHMCSDGGGANVAGSAKAYLLPVDLTMEGVAEEDEETDKNIVIINANNNNGSGWKANTLNSVPVTRDFAHAGGLANDDPDLVKVTVTADRASLPNGMTIQVRLTGASVAQRVKIWNDRKKTNQVAIGADGVLSFTSGQVPTEFFVEGTQLSAVWGELMMTLELLNGGQVTDGDKIIFSVGPIVDSFEVKATGAVEAFIKDPERTHLYLGTGKKTYPPPGFIFEGTIHLGSSDPSQYQYLVNILDGSEDSVRTNGFFGTTAENLTKDYSSNPPSGTGYPVVDCYAPIPQTIDAAFFRNNRLETTPSPGVAKIVDEDNPWIGLQRLDFDGEMAWLIKQGKIDRKERTYLCFKFSDGSVMPLASADWGIKIQVDARFTDLDGNGYENRTDEREFVPDLANALTGGNITRIEEFPADAKFVGPRANDALALKLKAE